MRPEWGMAVMPSTQLFTCANVVFEHQAAFWSMHFAPAAASEFSLKRITVTRWGKRPDFGTMLHVLSKSFPALLWLPGPPILLNEKGAGTIEHLAE